MLKLGSFLVSADYLRRNNKNLTGIIVEIKDDLWGKNYKVFLSNGLEKWIDESLMKNFFEEVE